VEDSKGIPGRLSALSYLAAVLAITAAGVGLAMYLRPSFGHTVRRLAGLEKPLLAAPGSFYTVRVEPLFDRHCVGCHGERMSKAQLRLDSFDAAMRGGKHGTVVMAGNAKDSELYFRMTLPGDDDRAMPPSGKEPLAKDELKVVRLWIEHNASGTLPASAVKGAPRLVAPITIPAFDPESARKARAAHDRLVIALQEKFPGMIAYESRDSSKLEVNAAQYGRRFGDAEFKALTPLASVIVRLDLSGTAVTDASALLLSKMQSLRQLRLLDVDGATGTMLRELPSLKALKSVAADGPVPSETLDGLRARKIILYRGSDG
jgi:mono/diheme cytochrome c family protein